MIPELWLDRPYYSLDAYCKNRYGAKVYKIALDAGLTCPNRDGTLGNRGCIFCSAGGSGDFDRHSICCRHTPLWYPRGHLPQESKIIS